MDLEGDVSIDWGVYGLQETFIVDEEGIIKYKHVGPIMKRDLKELESVIKNLLDEIYNNFNKFYFLQANSIEPDEMLKIQGLEKNS